MPSPAPSSASTASAPGATIRALRKRAGMTLSDLSERTGLAVSSLSKLEMGHISLSYDKLMLISKGLGVDIARLLDTASDHAAAPEARGRRVVHRAGEGLRVQTGSYDQRYLATELLNKRFVPIVVELHARTLDEFFAEFGTFIRHAGEEFAFVIEGEVELHTDLYAPLRLKAGDSVYFDSEMGHAYLKASDAPARLVAVCAPRGHDESDGLIETFSHAAERREAPAEAEPAPASTPSARRKAANGAAAKTPSGAAKTTASRRKR